MTDPKPPRNTRRWILLLIAAAMVLLAVGRVVYGLPRLGKEQLQAAQDLWRANQIPDYDVTIRVSGRQAAEYRVQVRQGEAREAWRNDAPLKQARTFRTWSVPGMFETMTRDVDHATGTIPVPGVGQLKLFCRFDRKYGFPREFLRVESGASNNDVSWKVVDFTPR